MSDTGFNTPRHAKSMEPYLERAVAQTLAAMFPERWGKLVSVSGRVLQEHEGSRATFELEIVTPYRMERVIAKRYGIDRFNIHERTQRLWNSGFRGLPRPMAYLRDLNLLLQEKVSGPSAQELLLSGDAAMRRAAAERSAEWLRCLQGEPAAGLPVFSARKYMDDLEGWSARLSQQLDGAASRVERLIALLQRERRELADVPCCPCHGSYGPGHILFCREPAVVFDWDGYCAADPCRDTARFLAAVRRLALARLGNIRALDDAVAVFVDRVASGRPEILRNLRFYQAAACLQLADYALSHRMKNWQQKALAMLDEGNFGLEQGRHEAA